MRLAFSLFLVGAFLLLSVAVAPGHRAATADSDQAESQSLVPTDDHSQPNGADVRVNESLSLQTYKVVGATASEIRAFMSASGPIAANDARRYDSVTNWSLTWSFRYGQAAGGCTLAGATIDFFVTEVVPEIQRPDALSPDIAARWQDFVSGLRAHEDGHVARERAGAAALKTDFETTRTATDCATLGASLNSLGLRSIEEIKDADAAWDQQTSHGRLQGAVFP